MSSTIPFAADVKTLQGVLFFTRKYRVPRNQRPYAWDIDKTSQLWEDLFESDEAYFLGSFIFNTESEERGHVEIIDGQQRLLTVTIMIAVLRDLAKKIDVKKADLYQRHGIAIEDLDGSHSFRILPADSIKGYFEEQIQKDTANILASTHSTPEEKRVKENYGEIHKRVSEELAKQHDTKQKIDLLDRLWKKIAAMIVICIEITKEEDAYDIFETTNARGLELSVADLLKNLIFKNIPAREDLDYAKDVWKRITQDVQSTETELKKFIRYYWISKYRFVPEKRLFKEIKNEMREKSWDKLLDELWTNSDIYNKMLVESEQEFLEIPGLRDLKHQGPKIYQSVFALRLMDVSQCLVFLLAVLRNLRKLKTNPTNPLQFIEKFSFQYSAICKLPANRVERIYSKYAIEIERAVANSSEKQVAGKIQSIFEKLKSDLRNLAPSEQVFKESFFEISYRNSETSRKLLKYILDRVDARLQKTDEYLSNFNTVNIEHVLPQNPRKMSSEDREEIKRYVNKLGNLTLLSKRINASLSNASPKEKLAELETSQLAITKDLVERLKENDGNWGEAEINERHEWMARLGYREIWRVVK